MNKSWKTTLFALVAATGGAVLGAYQLKPQMLAGFPAWLPGAGLLMSIIGTACLGVFARDNDKTSEQVGATGPSQSSNVPVKVLALLVACGLLAGYVTGCQSPPQRQAYNVVAAPAMTLDHVMQIWGDYVKANHPPVEQERAALNLYRKAKAAELAAIDAAHLAADTMVSTNLTATVTTSLQSPEAAQALSDLVDLVRQCGLKL